MVLEKWYYADLSKGEVLLEALFQELKSLTEAPKGQLAGKMGIVRDLMTRLPVGI